MGYRVDYLPIKKVRNMEKRTSYVPAMTALFLLLFFFLVSSFWPWGAEFLREVLIPGDLDVTVAALEAFAMKLQNGEAFSDAFKAFCHQLLEEDLFALY